MLTLNSVFYFGKYHGQPVREVADKNPDYIEWCANNLEHIDFSENVWNYLNGDSFEEDEDGKVIEVYCDDDDYWDYYEDNINYQEDTWYAMTDGMYGDYPGGDIDYDIFGF